MRSRRLHFSVRSPYSSFFDPALMPFCLLSVGTDESSYMTVCPHLLFARNRSLTNIFMLIGYRLEGRRWIDVSLRYPSGRTRPATSFQPRLECVCQDEWAERRYRERQPKCRPDIVQYIARRSTCTTVIPSHPVWTKVISGTRTEQSSTRKLEICSKSQTVQIILQITKS